MHTGYTHYAGDMLRWRLLFDFKTGPRNVRGMGVIRLSRFWNAIYIFDLRAETGHAVDTQSRLLSVLDALQMCYNRDGRKCVT